MSIIAACIAGDQAAKAVIRRTLEPLGFELIGGVLELHRITNPGMAQGIGVDWSEPLRWWVFTFGAGVAAGAFAGIAALSAGLSGAGRVGLALLAGGMMSNVIDRLHLDGAVLDIVAVRAAGYASDIFNPADAAITLGIIVLIAGRIAHRVVDSRRRR